MNITTYKIQTSMGELSSHGDDLDFLSTEELEEFNLIGYTGKNSKGEKSSFNEFLNSLDKGIFEITQTKFGSCDFIDEYIITRFSLVGTDYAFINIKDLNEKIEKLLEIKEELKLINKGNIILNSFIESMKTILKSCKQ